MKFGSNTIDAFKLGSANIDALYFGSNLIYTKSTPSLTPLVYRRYYSVLNFDTTKIPDFSIFGTIEYREIVHFGVDEYSPDAYAIQLISIDDAIVIRISDTIVLYTSQDVTIGGTLYRQGWQTNTFAFDQSYQIIDIDTTPGWNGVWVGGIADPSPVAYVVDTYGLFGETGKTYSFEIDGFVDQDGYWTTDDITIFAEDTTPLAYICIGTDSEYEYSAYIAPASEELEGVRKYLLDNVAHLITPISLGKNTVWYISNEDWEEPYEPDPEEEEEEEPSVMAHCAQCGNDILEGEDAASITGGGEDLYFCSEECYNEYTGTDPEEEEE